LGSALRDSCVVLAVGRFHVVHDVTATAEADTTANGRRRFVNTRTEYGR
jgi:hypothetical protein